MWDISGRDNWEWDVTSFGFLLLLRKLDMKYCFIMFDYYYGVVCFLLIHFNAFSPDILHVRNE